MKFSAQNSKVKVEVLHGDEVTVTFYVKPLQRTWREQTLKERAKFTARNFKWTIQLRVEGDNGRVDEHELFVSTPIHFLGANDVFRELMDTMAETWTVINRLEATFIPGATE